MEAPKSSHSLATAMPEDSPVQTAEAIAAALDWMDVCRDRVHRITNEAPGLPEPRPVEDLDLARVGLKWFKRNFDGRPERSLGRQAADALKELRLEEQARREPRRAPEASLNNFDPKPIEQARAEELQALEERKQDQITTAEEWLNQGHPEVKTEDFTRLIRTIRPLPGADGPSFRLTKDFSRQLKVLIDGGLVDPKVFVNFMRSYSHFASYFVEHEDESDLANKATYLAVSQLNDATLLSAYRPEEMTAEALNTWFSLLDPIPPDKEFANSSEFVEYSKESEIENLTIDIATFGMGSEILINTLDASIMKCRVPQIIDCAYRIGEAGFASDHMTKLNVTGDIFRRLIRKNPIFITLLNELVLSGRSGETEVKATDLSQTLDAVGIFDSLDLRELTKAEVRHMRSLTPRSTSIYERIHDDEELRAVAQKIATPLASLYTDRMQDPVSRQSLISGRLLEMAEKSKQTKSFRARLKRLVNSLP